MPSAAHNAHTLIPYTVIKFLLCAFLIYLSVIVTLSESHASTFGPCVTSTCRKSR